MLLLNRYSHLPHHPHHHFGSLLFLIFRKVYVYIKLMGTERKKISFRLHYSHYSFLSVSYVWDCCNIWSWTFVCSLLLYFSSFLHKTQENVLFITHNILSCLCTWFSFDVSLDYALKTYQGRKRWVKVDPWENHHPNLFFQTLNHLIYLYQS